MISELNGVTNSATSNETGGGEPPLEDVLHPVFPLLDADDFAEINAIYNQSFFQTLFEWFRAGTGEPELRCGVCFTSLASAQL